MDPILLVEDDDNSREALAELLAGFGYRVICARDGREALERAVSGAAIKLVLLDLAMPVMDGREFLKRRQQLPCLRGVPVIVISASNAGLPEGADAIIVKPIDVPRLMMLVRAYCGSRKRV